MPATIIAPSEPRRTERSDAYTRRTGHFPPHWPVERCQVQAARIHERQMAGDRAYLRRWGALTE